MNSSAGTEVDCDDNNVCSTYLDCDPAEGCLYDWIDCGDGDPCTIDTCDPQTAECEHEEMWPDGTFCDEVEGEPWVIVPGAPPEGWVFVNNDDDNANAIPDNTEAGVNGEDDLASVHFTIGAGSPFSECSCEHDLSLYYWHVQLRSSLAGAFYLDSDGAEPAQMDLLPTVPSVVYLEGLQPTDRCGVPARFGAWCPCVVHSRFAQSAPIPVIAVESLAWEKAADYPDNPPLGNNCPNNGGKQIFPGKTSPDDPSPPDRRTVDLVATIEPPIAGITVYFKVWDVDDPFDQNNPDMPDVGLIDNDQSGPDNRGTDPGVGTYPATTDVFGIARVNLTVSMQPGNNYRAGASLLQDALDQPPAGQTMQDVADALNANGGAWSGYSVPLEWSPMLTVWRKLHVEVDSMAMVDFTNTQNGHIPEAPTFDPANNHAIIPLEGLDPEFNDTDQHLVGRIDILTFGSFTTIGTDLTESPFTVEIIDAPPGIVNATGIWYTLWDDDAGSTEDFTMVGFDAPPVTLPKVPDTTLMADVYRNAYVDPAPPDMQYYDPNGLFARNINSEDEDNNAEAKDRANANMDLTSGPAYWAVHVTSAFQGWPNKDADPDVEQAGEGLQYGITIEEGYWPFPVHSSGSLIFLETIRDDKRGNGSAMVTQEQYTVVHESGHQFLLRHEDGYGPPEGPEGDYIMTNVTDQSGMAPNVAFSATSVKKIRVSEYPPQP